MVKFNGGNPVIICNECRTMICKCNDIANASKYHICAGCISVKAEKTTLGDCLDKKTVQPTDNTLAIFREDDCKG